MTKMDRRTFLKTTAAGASAAAVGSMLPHAALGADDIVVAQIHNQSGGLDIYGKAMVECFDLALDEINANGGLLGRQLRGVNFDPQSNMQLYAQYAQQAALKDRAVVVHGGITSASREVIRPVLRRFNTLYFYNTLYEGGVCDRNHFATGTTPAQTVEKLVPYCIDRFGPKIYTIAAIVASVLDHPIGSDLAVVVVGGAHMSFYRQWAAAGMKDEIPVASTTFGTGQENVALTAEEGRGIIYACGYFEDLDTPASKAFLERYRAKYGAEHSYLTELPVATYEGVHLWAKAVNQAGSLDRMKVIEALETGMSFDGPSGKVKIDPKTHHCSRSAFIAECENQRFKFLASYENQFPADTAAVCDLEANPNDNQHYKIEI